MTTIKPLNAGPNWSQLLGAEAKRFQLTVKTDTFESNNIASFTKQHIVAFNIKHDETQEEVLSFNLRVRGFLNYLAKGLTVMAEQGKLDIGVASQNGQTRQAQILRRVRVATLEEQRELGASFISENEPIDPEQLWKEFQASPPNRPGRVLISFAHRL